MALLHERLTEQIIGAAFEVYRLLDYGYLEKVYENALVHRLRKAGFRVSHQQPITIQDEDGCIVGEYFADIVVNESLLIELKACKTITPEHQAQLLHYLKATNIEHGLLVNFGAYRFEIQKFIRNAHHP